MIVEKVGAGYTDFRIPGMVVTEKGTLLRYCECRRAAGDWADILFSKAVCCALTVKISKDTCSLCGRCLFLPSKISWHFMEFFYEIMENFH